MAVRKASAMRGIECVVPNCGHLHAITDEALIEVIRRHMREAHPDAALDPISIRSQVAAEAYEDAEHTPKTPYWERPGP